MKPRSQFDLEVDGRTIRLGERTIIMGVLNVTPDSFWDGGRYINPGRAIQHGLKMARNGAHWIDVGGESTRPGSLPIPAEEELGRVLPVIRGLRRRLRGVPISIDTTKSKVAEEALLAGASILNDVSGLRFDPRLAEIARRHKVPLILMHIRGKPATMQRKPFPHSIWRSLHEGLAWSIRRALSLGVRRSQLIIDPGMGFGKSRRQNFEILAHLDRLRRLGLPVLIGTSRKSFVQAIVAGEELEVSRARKTSSSYWPQSGSSRSRSAPPPPLQLGDAATVAASILAGAHIVRVHDVAAILPAVRIADSILEAGAMGPR